MVKASTLSFNLKPLKENIHEVNRHRFHDLICDVFGTETRLCAGNTAVGGPVGNADVT